MLGAGIGIFIVCIFADNILILFKYIENFKFNHYCDQCQKWINRDKMHQYDYRLNGFELEYNGSICQCCYDRKKKIYDLHKSESDLNIRRHYWSQVEDNQNFP